MGLKLFGTNGIDQRKNYITRDKKMLSDARNIRRTKNDEYSKRSGQSIYQDENPLMTTRPFEPSNQNMDFNFINKNNGVFYYDGFSYIDTVNGRAKRIFWEGTYLTGYNGDRDLCTVESLGCVLFTHYKDPNAVMKYDGKYVYKAGLPTPTPSSKTIGTDGYFNLMYYSFIDAQGNQIDGPSVILKNITSFKLTQDHIEGFCNFQLFTDRNYTDLGTVTRTVSILPGMDRNFFSVGDKIPVRGNGPNNNGIRIFEEGDNLFNPSRITLMLEIESIGEPDPIDGRVDFTFTEESFKQCNIVITRTGLINFHCGLMLKLWYSPDEFTGYSSGYRDMESFVNFTYEKWDGAYSFNRYLNTSDPSDSTILSVEYDLNTSKIRPPLCKYLYMYGYQLVCGNVIGFYDFENNLNSYTNNDLIMYSDLSAGDTPESFSEANRQLVGETHDGEVTAMARVNDSLIVFKNGGLHALDGILIPGNFIRRTISNDSGGCATFKSIIETSEGIIYQGYNAIYVTNGYEVREISENFFEMIDLIDVEKSRGCKNPDFNEALLYARGKMGENFIFCFNLKNGGIYIWEGINASMGLLLNNQREVLAFGRRDDNKVMILDSSLNDVGDPINAYIRTSFLDMEEPGLLKKINEFRLYAFSNRGQSVGFKLFSDWNWGTPKMESSMEELVSPTVKTKNQKTGTFNAQSFALELSNNIVDEDLCISDFEIDMKLIQFRDKNVK